VTEPLMERLEKTFHLATRIRPPWFDPEDAFNSSRGQYNSTAFLELLLSEPPERGHRVIAVTSVDLYIPVFTYVFGEAQLNGRAAVVSIHRLQPEIYGLPSDDRLLTDRLIKEVVHELGHTYGLIHCADDRCVMRSSSYVEELETKNAEFCERCRNAIEPEPEGRT
jgi:archaemetzincin